ncbi:ATP-binding protein [Vineibacter terrae]|uniref:ATP-binding protein n=1 Tax=Vineibacter terrae TaxID=2586908 RepID=A0A5C8PM95_9HYPH|nr:ATP-binding protein [Vineibacter terrae]TXL75439.1 ATP-binding protein [Vineibacter terrae]
MDIAIIGPEKFAFQDMACIELALSFRPFGPFALVPEPTGGEDASLTWDDGALLTLEVQVKGAKGSAGVAELLDYLVHYPSREVTGSLLQRLMEQDDRHALFILTARCTDDLTPLLLARPLIGRPASRIAPRALAEALRNEVSAKAATKPPKNASKLTLERLANLEDLARRPVADFERALAKIALREQETAETIEVHLHTAMRAERFDTLSIRGILARFGDLLAESKRTRSDALGPILTALAAHAPSALGPHGYLERGIEAALEARLRTDRSLLITGPPRAGKSWTARAMAGQLQRDGFEVRQGSFVEEAERFLTDPMGAERVYVLDDPIGSREPHTDANARLAALGALTERIPANRRLIVAQTEQVLLQTKAAPDLIACGLGGRAWLRLEPLPVERAEAIWRSAAETQLVPAVGVSRVAELISREPGLRDPGALAYLAQTWSELSHRPLDAEIVLQARKDASDFARTLAMQTPGLSDLLTASALATTASDGAAASDLAFIISGGNDRPALAPKVDVVTIGHSRPPPSYPSEPLLSEQQRHGLEVLQRRRVIEDRDGRYNFTHPYLRAGAQALVTPDIPADLQRIRTQLERAIACPSPVTSLAAARNLRWTRSALQCHATSTVFDIAHQGTRSLFPATRDCCFEFLVEFADLLPEELRDDFPCLSERMVIELEDIDVAHGFGFVSNRYDWPIAASPIEEVQPYLDAIEDGSPLGLDLSLSRRILQTLDAHPTALTGTAVRRFLRADEAVVRATVARIWARIPRYNDEDVLARLEGDATPTMTTALLNELAHSWESLPKERRERVLATVVAHARSPSCASVLLSRLVLFNRVERFGEQPPWQVFTTLMPVVIANLPISVSFADDRFCVAIDDAIRAVPSNELVPVLDAWGDRLLQRLDRYLLSESELAIVDPLLAVAPESGRVPILQRLLRVRDTGARIVTTRWLAHNWDELGTAERALLEEVIGDHRVDQRWLSATILTLHRPPTTLVAVLTGDLDSLERSTEEIERKLGASLFAACVHMFVGWPQPLWWYGTHHSRSPIWTRVIRDLARDPNHPLHPLAFYEIANFGGEDELAKLVDELPDAALLGTFERLLDFKVSHVGDWRQKAWQRLLARADQTKLLDDFVMRIDEELDGILERLSDVGRWLGERDLLVRVARLLPNDLRALRRARNLRTTFVMLSDQLAKTEGADMTMAEQVFATLCAEELKALKAAPPRIFGTWDEIGRIFESVGATAEVRAALEGKRRTAVKRHHAIRQRFRGSPAPVAIEGWINQARQYD